jgi:hypothetical protein
MTKFKPSKDIPEFIQNFIRESNAIERIYRDPTPEESLATERFLELEKITLEDLQDYVSACQPDAELRDREGLNVYIGNYVPPAGGISIKTRLEDILNDANNDSDPFRVHKQYESLHPFTDGNGRSGRIIWLWQMLRQRKNLAPLGFLQSWYYQSLSQNQ